VRRNSSSASASSSSGRRSGICEEKKAQLEVEKMARAEEQRLWPAERQASGAEAAGQRCARRAQDLVREKVVALDFAGRKMLELLATLGGQTDDQLRACLAPWG
jgi:hypothetical protein